MCGFYIPHKQAIPLKRPASCAVMVRPASAALKGPCHLVLNAEPSRSTWRARVDATSTGFRYGIGQEFKSGKAARAAALAHLDSVCKRYGRKEFPRDACSLKLM